MALADALEESGQAERAELLRLTRRLLTLPRDGDQRPAAEARLGELLAAGVGAVGPRYTNRLGMEFALVPPGTYWIGSPEDEPDRDPLEALHPVLISRPFWLGRHPVTQGQFVAVMGSNPSGHTPSGESSTMVAGLDTDTFPVEGLTWEDAAGFLSRLSSQDAPWRYRLPSDAEWEYACRAGTTTAYHFGPEARTDRANVSGEDELRRPCPVGSYLPNAFGLFDMHGNVWEMCRGSAGEKVLRGGAFDVSGLARAACRISEAIAAHNVDPGSDLGFRAAIDWEAP
jgi:formylglycine-generating enzyme required for sulfatase activity